MAERVVTNWNNFPKLKSEYYNFSQADQLRDVVPLTKGAISRGNGRSYGDASLSPIIFSALYMNKVLQFDTNEGIFIAQSGVLFEDILSIVVPKGWFLPVTLALNILRWEML